MILLKYEELAHEQLYHYSFSLTSGETRMMKVSLQFSTLTFLPSFTYYEDPVLAKTTSLSFLLQSFPFSSLPVFVYKCHCILWVCPQLVHSPGKLIFKFGSTLAALPLESEKNRPVSAEWGIGYFLNQNQELSNRPVLSVRRGYLEIFALQIFLLESFREQNQTFKRY